MTHYTHGLNMYKVKNIHGIRFYNMRMFMQLISPLLLFLFYFNCTSPNSNMNIEENLLTLTGKITMPDVSGRIDHIAYDTNNHLAFVAALGHNTIEVVNIDTKQVVHTIKGLHEPQGVAYISSLQRLVVANGTNGQCIFFDAKNFSHISSIDLKDDADNIRYDATTNLLYVGYGSGAIAIMDANTMKQVASIPLDGHPESFNFQKNKIESILMFL